MSDHRPRISVKRRQWYALLITVAWLSGMAAGIRVIFYIRSNYEPDVLLTWTAAFGGFGLGIVLATVMFFILFRRDRWHAAHAVKSLLFDPKPF